MERAGATCSEWIADYINRKRINDIRIFCGSGNNGGDGLVIARLLSEQPMEVVPTIEVVLCESEHSHRTSEMVANLNRWQSIVCANPKMKLTDFREDVQGTIPADALIVDAIFGIGLNRPVEGLCASAIRHINASDTPVIAIDTPSGLLADVHTPDDATVVMADITLSIQFPKTAYFLPESFPFCGEVNILDIGMCPPPELLWEREYLTESSIAPILRPRPPYAHKGTFGHGLLVAGSADMPGAAILAATAAMRGGIGKVTVHTAVHAAQHIPTRLPEAILHPDSNEHHVTELRWETLQRDINAIAIGPGIGTHPKTVTLLKNILDEVHSPVILDADALNILSENKTWLAFLPPYSILTPHFKEFERLAGKCNDDFDRLEKAKDFAQRYNIVLILKGFHTLISLPDGKQFFNTTGNPGMATAGSGDILTGLLLALLAQGYNPVESALLGVYIHGMAGDFYAERHTPQSLIASDLPTFFPNAFRKLNLYE
jgi:NAD(P)H-hydrate epimerase